MKSQQASEDATQQQRPHDPCPQAPQIRIALGKPEIPWVRNRRRDRIKILYWDRDGFAVWAKRLEEGTYAMPFGDSAEKRREITAAELGALLSGIDLSHAKRRKRYVRQSIATA